MSFIIRMKNSDDDDEIGCAAGGIKEVDDDMRAAELRDEILFKQPESSHLGDCPICCLPISIGYFTMSCCCKYICRGCAFTNQKREFEKRLERKCPFCRHPITNSKEENKINFLKRAEANDPIAMIHLGANHYEEGDYKKAFDYWTKAAELGDIGAHYNLSRLYYNGHGVEKNEEKEMYHLEEAAIGGHADARYALGNFEADNKRYDRAIKHHIIAANQGHDNALELLKKNYAHGNGFVTKDVFAAALRAHRAAVLATKSPQREEEESVR